MKVNKKSCQNCFFCVKTVASAEVRFTSSLSEDNRQGNFESGSIALSCYNGEWSEQRNQTPKRENLSKYKCRKFIHYKTKKLQYKSLDAAKKMINSKKSTYRFCILAGIGLATLAVTVAMLVINLMQK